MSAHARRLGLLVAVLGIFAIAAAAQAAPKLYSGTLSIHAFGRYTPTYYTATIFTAIPLGAHCNTQWPTPMSPAGMSCGYATLQQGAPLTGSGTASTTEMVTPPGFTLPASGLARIASGSLPYYFPYIYSYTYADLKNQAGSFFVKGGPGSFSLPYTDGGFTVANVAAKQGPNQFGGTMRLLGAMRSKFAYAYAKGLSKGSIDWRFDILGATAYTSGGVVTAGYIGTAIGTIYYHSYYTMLITTHPLYVFGSAFPWTTGTVSVTATGRGLRASREQRKGYDKRTSMGQGTIQLVSPLLTHWLEPPFSAIDTAAIGILRLTFTDPAVPEAGPALAAPRVGPQFQVNTYTTGRQYRSSVALDADGDFVVVWQSAGSLGSDTDLRSIQGQRYDASGNAVGGEFQVNTYTTSDQEFPSVSADASGNFVVVWQSRGSAGTDSSFFSVQGQRYDASGIPVGGEFQVNTYTTNSQRFTSVGVDADGDFVVVWSSNGSAGSDTSYGSIQGQRYDTGGNPVGGEFQINTYTTEDQGVPSVAVDPSGNFVVVWGSEGSSGTDTSAASVQGQRYDASGSPVGPEFQVNTYTTNLQQFPSVSVDGDGGFVVVWHSNGSADSDTSSYSVQGQRYDGSGSPVGGEFQVNTYTTLNQYWPWVAADADGGFVVVWDSNGSFGSDTDFRSIQGQRYDASANALGAQFQVNSYTTQAQATPSLASDADGDFVVTWLSTGSAGSDTFYSIQAQRYEAPEAHWRFEEGAGSSAPDSEDGNTGTISGATYTTDTPALPDATANDFALLFDDKGDYVTAAADSTTNLHVFANGLTVEASIRPAALPIPLDGASQRIKQIVWADDAVFELRLESDGAGNTDLQATVNAVAGSPGPCTASAVAPFAGGTTAFSHVALTYGADETLRLYLDGVELAQASAASCGSQVGPVESGDIVRIGSDETAVGFPTSDRDFRGEIDEVRITGAALDPSQFVFPPDALDSDGDGLLNAVETDTGVFVSASDTGSDPFDADSDADGLSDGDEVNTSGTDPNNPDSDADTICDGGNAGDGVCTPGPDNCPLASNEDQIDSGGLNTSSPDGIGDACQCGDVTGNGIVDATDLQAQRENLVGATLSGTFVGKRCNVIGPRAGDASGSDCDVADGYALDAALRGQPVALENACDAYFGL